MPLNSVTITALLPAPPRIAGRLSLFLDLDGVLAPMASSPDAVGPEPRRTAVLVALDHRLEGRLAIVSGRTLVEIDRIAGGASPSASGVHGLERRRRDGSIERAAASAAVVDVVEAFKAFAAERPGVIVEDKGVSASLHYRQSPASEAAAVALAEHLRERTGLTLQPGHMVLELKTPGADKGSAVNAFMAEAPFRGSVPVMVGDDLTDEAGFRAASGAPLNSVVRPHEAAASHHYRGRKGRAAVQRGLGRAGAARGARAGGGAAEGHRGEAGGDGRQHG
jgi:trehalose 6-phosphate phosphatase